MDRASWKRLDEDGLNNPERKKKTYMTYSTFNEHDVKQKMSYTVILSKTELTSNTVAVTVIIRVGKTTTTQSL